MTNKCKNENELLLKFYQSLPNDIIMGATLAPVFPNRAERRKFEKQKTISDIISAILGSASLRVEFAHEICNNYFDDNAIDEYNTYSETLTSFTNENCIGNTALVIYKCFSQKFSDTNLADFLMSEQFKKTVNNSWGEDAVAPVVPAMATTTLANTTKTIDEKVAEKQNAENLKGNKINNKIIDKIINERYSMQYYLGYIEQWSTFYNFVPEYTLQNDKITNIDNAIEMFPIHGKINLEYELYHESNDFLKNLSKDMGCNYYAIPFNSNQLKPNIKDGILKKDVEKRIELENDIIGKGILLKDYIRNINELHIYKTVSLKDSIDEPNFIDGTIFVKENYVAGEMVLLNYHGALYGPYELSERALDGEKYIKPDVGNSKNNYLLDYYMDANDNHASLYRKNNPYEEAVYFDVAGIFTKPEKKDIIPIDILLGKLSEPLDARILVNDPQELVRIYNTSPYLTAKIPQEIKKLRLNRIKDIIINLADYETAKRQAVVDLLSSYSTQKDISTLLEDKIKETPTYKDIQDKFDETKKLNTELQESYDKLDKKCKDLEMSGNSAIIKDENATQSDKKDLLNKEIADLERKIKEYKITYSEYDSFEKIKEEKENKSAIIKYLEEQIKEKENQKATLEIKISGLHAAVKDVITSGVNDAKMAQNAFDPYISNAMIEAAGNWQAQSDKSKYLEAAEFFHGKEPMSARKDKDELKKYLVNGVKKIRNYQTNDIINMYICLSQNFITIFSGEPGTGKTTMCSILSSSLGTKLFPNFVEKKETEEDKTKDKLLNLNRFVPISVERGWSSKRDLIGYFNPLTKKYDKSNGKIYDALMILDTEKNMSAFPYIVLLDEANLSQMEYYWADFMRVADKDDGDIYINIGMEEDIYIPNTLRFLATINNDQTTEQLSPRLIDRAWVIKLPKTETIYDSNIKYGDVFKEIILWNDIQSTFANATNSEILLSTPIKQIYELFAKHNLAVSPRVKLSIKNYICVAQEIMEDEPSVSKKEKAVDFAVLQKLLPKINGYYSNYQMLFKSLRLICEDNHLLMTKAALDDMENFKEQNMGYCQYLV